MADQSILILTKKALGLDAADPAFDSDIIMFINSTFSTLSQLGVGPKESYFTITDATNTWSSFIGDLPNLEMVKAYMYLKVRMLFDPPATSFLQAHFNEELRQFEFRLMVEMDNFWRPLPPELDEDGNPVTPPPYIPPTSYEGQVYDLTGDKDFPDDAPVGAIGVDYLSGNVWRNTA